MAKTSLCDWRFRVHLQSLLVGADIATAWPHDDDILAA
jgi:hypothetical protein